MWTRTRPFSAGVIVGVIAIGSFWAAGRPSAGTRAAVQDAPKYATRIVLENDRVRVKEAIFPPGVLDTGMHTHDLPHVGVILTKGELLFTDQNGKTERVAFEAGSVGYRGPNVTHQVANPGPEPMRVIEVELK
jgi:mannose-6-phosphate isomerase-like protein (cupin superfamily)